MIGFTYGGVAFGSQYSLFADDSKTFVVAELDYTKIEVPGRNGDLLISNDRFKNVTIKLDCFIKDDFPTNFRNLMNHLRSFSGYQKLVLPSDSSRYRMGILKGVVQAKTTSFNKSGFFTLEFDCKPQRFLLSGDEEILLSITRDTATITNPTRFLAKPIITNHEGGGMYVSINGDAFSLVYDDMSTSAHSATVNVDCDLMTVASGTTNFYEYFYVVRGNGFPYLLPGENTVTFRAYDPVTEYAIGITPRWYEL